MKKGSFNIQQPFAMKWLLSATAASLLLSACSNTNNQGVQESSNPSVKPTSKEPANVVFYYAAGEPDKRYFDMVLKKFPEYNITFIPQVSGRTIPDMITSGLTFDIFQDGLGAYETKAVDFDFLYDMNDLIKSHKVDLSTIEPSIMAAIKQAFDGKVYALPVTSNTFVNFYNKSIFDKFGVPYPKDGMTWDETFEIAKKLTRLDGGTYYYGMTNSPVHMFRINQMSIPMADLKTNVPSIAKDERWKRFFDYMFVKPAMQAEYQAGMLAAKKAPNLDTFYKDQTVGMYVYLSSLFANPEYLEKMNWDMVSIPTFTELPGVGTQAYPGLFGITKMAKNKDAAMEVLKYLISDELQTQISKLGILPTVTSPAVKKAFGQSSPFQNKNFNASFYHKFAPIPPKAVYDSPLATIYAKYAGKMINNELDSNTAFRMAEEEAVKKIAEYIK